MVVMIMECKKIYESKLTTAEEAIKLIHDGDKIVVSLACGEPYGIEKVLAENYKNYTGVELYNMLSLVPSPWNAEDMKEHIKINTFFASASTRGLIESGAADYTPCHFYEIPAVIRDYIKPRVAIVTVSPPDEHGYCSLGTSVDYSYETCECAEVIIAQVNKNMPRTLGRSSFHVSRFAAFVEIDDELPQVGSAEISEIETKIGKNCASLIKDGDCLQLGIGNIPNAICKELRNLKDLGLHSELVGDGVVELLEAGVINNSKKQINPGKTVLGAALGTKVLNAYIDNNPAVEFYPISYVNHPAVIAQNDNVVSVNSCLQVDFLGQVVSDTVGFRQYSGVGGQVDFVRGATMSRGGRSIIAMPSLARHGTLSRIVPLITEGCAVTTPRNDVNFVVTEHGIAELKGKSVKNRARALIEIAHPDFRAALSAAFEERFGEKVF